jgi:hypothetical protein
MSNLLPLVSQVRDGTLMLVLETIQRILGLGTVQQNARLCNDLAQSLMQPVVNGSLKSECFAILSLISIETILTGL